MRILLLIDRFVPSTVPSAEQMRELVHLSHDPLVAAPDGTLNRSS